MNVGILSIATGKYIQFLEPLYRSIEKFFLLDHKKTYIIFTDNPKEVEDISGKIGLDAVIFKIEKKGFPGDTLYRYHHFSNARELLKSMGENCPKVLFYMDADMLIVDNVGDEIMPTRYKPIVATAHPGFYMRSGNHPYGTPETNSKSKAFIPDDRWRPCYWAGGFNGGNFEAFMSMSNAIKGRVDEDDKNGITAIWHDESHLNAYLSEVHYQIKTLSPSYCFAEYDIGKSQYKPKIIALVKNNEFKNES